MGHSQVIVVGKMADGQPHDLLVGSDGTVKVALRVLLSLARPYRQRTETDG